MTTPQLRIVNDIMNFNKEKPNNTFIDVNEKNIYQLKILIIGDKSTPYYGGFFMFELEFPDNYPHQPPKVKFLTTDGIVRFNPNLYANGKVCLSIINTWTGPQWTPVMSLLSVVVSIQSLLKENPIINEPGYENYTLEMPIAYTYNNYVIFNTYKIGIIEMLKDNICKIPKSFKKHMIDYLKENKEDLNNNLLSYESILKDFPVLKANMAYFISKNLKSLNFTELKKQFENI
jgi:ubiquitin-protein ligase